MCRTMRVCNCTICKGTGVIDDPRIVLSYNPVVPCPFCSDSATPELDIKKATRYFAKINKDGKLVEQERI